MRWFKVRCCGNDNQMPLNVSLTLSLPHLEAENKYKSNSKYIFVGWCAVVLSIDNMRTYRSTAGCKIFKISDRNVIGLALMIMDVIKVGCAILINLSLHQSSDCGSILWNRIFSSQHHLSKHTYTLGWNTIELDLCWVHHLSQRHRQYKIINVSSRSVDLDCVCVSVVPVRYFKAFLLTEWVSVIYIRIKE